MEIMYLRRYAFSQFPADDTVLDRGKTVDSDTGVAKDGEFIFSCDHCTRIYGRGAAPCEPRLRRTASADALVTTCPADLILFNAALAAHDGGNLELPACTKIDDASCKDVTPYECQMPVIQNVCEAKCLKYRVTSPTTTGTSTPTTTPTSTTSVTTTSTTSVTSTTTTASTTTTTTATTTTTMDAAGYKAQAIEMANLKEALVGMSAAELLSKGFTVQELYDGGFAIAEIEAAGDDGAEFQLPESYDAQYSALIASLNPDDKSSPIAAIVGALLAIIVVLAAGFLIGRCNNADDAGDGVFSKCMGAGSSNTGAPINAQISSFTVNPSYPQSPSAAAPSQMYGPTHQTQPTLNLDGAYEEVGTSGTAANVRAAYLYDDGDGADEFSAAASAVAGQSVYESPSSRQMQVYDDGKVLEAADHFAGGAYASVGNDRKAYGSISATSSATYADIDGPYDEVGDEQPYDEIDDDDIEL